jgi:hypothetical protein
VSSVRYELGFYIPEDDFLHSGRREYLTSYTLDRMPCLRQAVRSFLFVIAFICNLYQYIQQIV